MDAGSIGKLPLLMGAVIMVAGGALLLLGHAPALGRLPGDFVVQRPGFTFVFPLATSILLSILLTVALNLALRRFNR
ncbi:MAG: DUF2905 domain-containing protein [Chloroflexi bacterium]|nr:DUF2905 domain-containing protein [Chloroflexota bacterium]